MSEQGIILSPDAPIAGAVAVSGRAFGDLSGKTIGFIDNTKPNFNLLVDDMAELFVRRYGAAGAVKYRKRAESERASDAVMQDIQEKCDLVITGSGD